LGFEKQASLSVRVEEAMKVNEPFEPVRVEMKREGSNGNQS